MTSAITPDPSIHNIPSFDSGAITLPEIEAQGQQILTGIEQWIALALLNVSILGVKPFAALQAFGKDPGGVITAMLTGLGASGSDVAALQTAMGDVASGITDAEEFIQQVLDAIANALGQTGTSHTATQVKGYLEEIPGANIVGELNSAVSVAESQVSSVLGGASTSLGQDVSSIVTDVTNAVTTPLATAETAVKTQLTNAFTGLFNALTGGSSAAASASDVATGAAAHSTNIIATGSSVAQLQQPAANLGPVSAAVNFALYLNSSTPPPQFTTTTVGSGTGVWTISSGELVWAGGNSSAVTQYEMYDVEPTGTDYQLVSAILNGSIAAGEDLWLLGRANSASSPTEYVGLQLEYDTATELTGQINYKNSSTTGALGSSFTLAYVPGATYALQCGIWPTLIQTVQANTSITMSYTSVQGVTQTTSTIAAGASAATVQSALQALSLIGSNVTVTASAGVGSNTIYVISFGGKFSESNTPTALTANLVGTGAITIPTLNGAPWFQVLINGVPQIINPSASGYAQYYIQDTALATLYGSGNRWTGFLGAMGSSQPSAAPPNLSWWGMQDQIFPAGPPSTALVSTSESTSSTTYTDLTTTTDTVTVTIGSSGMCEVWLSGLLTTTYDGGGAYMSFTMSGANTQAASDAESIYCEVYVPGSAGAIGVSSVGIPLMLYNLTPGVTTFKAKYRSSAYTTTFANRRITAIPI